MMPNRFQIKVQNYMLEQGWTLSIQPKHTFPAMYCWRPVMKETMLFEILAVEVKISKYLNPDEKEKTMEILRLNKCNKFVVAYRKSNKLLFYEYKLNHSGDLELYNV